MRNILLSSGIELVPAEEGGSAFEGDREATRDLVRRLFLDPWDRLHLREVLAEELSPIPISEWTNDQVIDLFAQRLSAGEWTMVRRTVDIVPPERKKETRPQEATSEKTGWIEIELLDDFNEPVPGEAYRVEFPNGKGVEGTLNAMGFARIRDIESGEGQITFPRLDKEVWKKIQITPPV